MKFVVATSLFDDHARYQLYFPAALRAHYNLFRNWIYRVYHDHLVDQGPYGRTLRALEAKGLVELRFVTKEVLIEKAMLWRLYPLWDNDCERFLMRDVDMVASYRERRAVETWVRSGLAVHAISDRRGAHDWPSIPGMMGFNVTEARRLLDVGPGHADNTLEKFFMRAGWRDEIWASNHRANGGNGGHRISNRTTNNQYFVADQIWSRVKSRACEHRLGANPFYDGALQLREVDLFEGEDLGVLPAIRGGSDLLVPFIGASEVNSNINLSSIVNFYKQHGDPEVEQKIAACELEGDWK